jgi:hypothetical protein
MAKKFKVGNALLADYVGQGNRNKHTLVNVYAGDVIVQKFPVDLAFGVYVELLLASTDGAPSEFEVELMFGGKPVLKAKGRVKVEGSGKNTIFVIPMFQLTVENEGQLELKISAEGFNRTTLISKHVSQGEFT